MLKFSKPITNPIGGACRGFRLCFEGPPGTLSSNHPLSAHPRFPIKQEMHNFPVSLAVTPMYPLAPWKIWVLMLLFPLCPLFTLCRILFHIPAFYSYLFLSILHGPKSESCFHSLKAHPYQEVGLKIRCVSWGRRTLHHNTAQHSTAQYSTPRGIQLNNRQPCSSLTPTVVQHLNSVSDAWLGHLPDLQLSFTAFPGLEPFVSSFSS